MKIIDMHCDTIHEILVARNRGESMNLRKNRLMVDLEKMRQGGYSVQNFALFVEQESGIRSFSKMKELLSVFKEEMRCHADWISQVTTTEEILENERAGKLSALLTVEGGEACEGSLELLHFLYDEGVRMMTLTWNYPNEIGYPNFKEGVDFFTPNLVEGLTDTGICVVEEMERIGMIIDVSHLSDAGFYDVLQNTRCPFVASHSNAREVSPWVRNLTDDMIRKLADRGGVIGLNYCADFLRVQDGKEWKERYSDIGNIEEYVTENMKEHMTDAMKAFPSGDVLEPNIGNMEEYVTGVMREFPSGDVLEPNIGNMEEYVTGVMREFPASDMGKRMTGNEEKHIGIQNRIIEKKRNNSNGNANAIPGSKATEGARASMGDIARHAKHIANVGGIECIGLGSDFDGIPVYQGMPHMESMNQLAEVLKKYGFHESEIDKIFYENVFRLYQEVLG